MKKIPALLLTLFFVLNIHAQSNKWEVGFSGGYGLSQLRSAYSPYNANQIGSYSIGLSVQQHFNHRFSLFTGLLFERKGNKITGILTDVMANPIGNYSSTFDKSYLVLPLLARFHLLTSRHLFINMGPSFGFSMRDVEIVKITNQEPVRNVYTGASRKLDVVGSIGIGYKVAVVKKHFLSAELRYNHGFSGITTNSVLKTQNALLVLGYTKLF